MKVVIIGWYGTETIGDRAILAGLIVSIKKALGKYDLSIGSLYPFFTERTIIEDYKYWKKLIGIEINVSVFDSKNINELEREIKKSDIVAMGGGPLMHISELYMVSYAFAYAKKRKKKTALLGCGIGPIYNSKYHKPLLDIINKSDIVILRDEESYERLKGISKEAYRKNKNKTHIQLDPAVIACYYYMKCCEKNRVIKEEYICINMRSFPVGYSSNADERKINDMMIGYVAYIAEKNQENNILLIPMHYFHIGDDDRRFLNEIQIKVGKSNISVQNKNLDLFDTMNVYENAIINIGMRFHSVVFQTIVSGKNYILDYTEPKIGKISGFLSTIGAEEYYKKRYINIQDCDGINMDLNNKIEKYKVDNNIIEKVVCAYKEYIKNIF